MKTASLVSRIKLKTAPSYSHTFVFPHMDYHMLACVSKSQKSFVKQGHTCDLFLANGIEDVTQRLDGMNILYLGKVAPDHYKYGITYCLNRRIQTHIRVFGSFQPKLFVLSNFNRQIEYQVTKQIKHNHHPTSDINLYKSKEVIQTSMAFSESDLIHDLIEVVIQETQNQHQMLDSFSNDLSSHYLF
jgi:hypothetical protein